MSIILEPCRWAYIGGRLIPAERATLPIDNHALHFGSAAFESLRLYRTPIGTRIVGIEQHLDRFESTMAMLRVVPAERDTVRRALLDVIAANELDNGYIRLLAYPGGNCSRLDPAFHTTEMLALAWRVEGARFAPPLTLGVAAIRRPPAFTTLPRAKHSGMYGIYAAMHSTARAAGYDDALVLHADGTVCEVTGANIFLAKDGALATPPIPDSIDGVTRRLVMAMAASLGIQAAEAPLTLEDFAAADEIFITGTFHGLRAVASIDGRAPRLGAPGPLTARLQARYEAMLDAPGADDAQWATTIAYQAGAHRNGEHRNGEHRSGEHRSGEHRSGEHRSGEHDGPALAHTENGIGPAAGLQPVFRVRPAERRDIPAVLEGVRQLLEELRGVPGITLPEGAEAVCTRTVEGRLRGAIFVAELNGPATNGSATNGTSSPGVNGSAANGAAGEAGRGLIGVLCLSIPEAIHVGGTYGLIQDLWVHPDHRSDGVGAALVAAAERYCHEHRIGNIEVCLPSHRFPRLPRTHNFYQSCGFIELGPRMRKEVA